MPGGHVEWPFPKHLVMSEQRPCPFVSSCNDPHRRSTYKMSFLAPIIGAHLGGNEWKSSCKKRRSRNGETVMARLTAKKTTTVGSRNRMAETSQSLTGRRFLLHYCSFSVSHTFAFQ